MIDVVAGLLLVAYLPGALLFRLPGRSREYRAALPADERCFWAILLSLLWSMLLVLGLGFAGRYSFNGLLTINGVAVAAAVIGIRQRLRFHEPVGRRPWSALVPVALVGLGLWLYFPPAEYVIGGKDPGTYINEGVQIAQSGRVIIRDATIAAVPPPLRDLFFPSHGQATYYGLRFMGFFIQDPSAGSVIAQFPHLYPASIAIGYGLDGLSGARNAIGVWAILGLLAVYFAGAQIFGRAAAAAAAGLLGINVVVTWFARYPNSELPMQTLLFGALLAAARARSGGGRFFGVAAGALLGFTLFLRYEVLLAMVAFAAVAVLAPVTRERFGASFTVALAVTSCAGLWYLVGPMRAYSSYPLGFIHERGGWLLAGGAVAGALATRWIVGIDVMSSLVRRWLPRALAVTLGGLAVYAYFFRDAGGRTALGDAMAFRSFGWYLTPWGLGLAACGAVVLTWRRFWQGPVFFTTFLVFSLFFFYKTRIVPEHFWASRRFLGMALPGALLLATAVIREIVGPKTVLRIAARGWRLTPAAADRISTGFLVAAVVPIGLAFWSASAPVARHVEYAGLIPKLEALAAKVGPRDLLVVEARNAGSDLHVLAVPLAYIYARQVLVLNSPAPEKRVFEQFVAWARPRYDNVLFLGGGGTDLLTRDVSAAPIWGDRFQVPEYDTPLNRYPTGIHHKEFEFGLYRLMPVVPAPSGPIDVSIGTLDDLNVLRFHAREVHGETGVPFRWTRGQSFVLLMGLSAQTRSLTVWMSSGGRPAIAPPPAVELFLADTRLGTATPRDAIEPFTFNVPADLAQTLAALRDPARLQLRVAPWNPGQLVGAPDTRDLGVIVTRVEVK